MAGLACYCVSIKSGKAVKIDGFSTFAPRLGGDELDTNNTIKYLAELFHSKKLGSDTIQEFRQVHLSSVIPYEGSTAAKRADK